MATLEAGPDADAADRATQEISMKVFHFNISHEESLTVEEIWPDGDAPENPTLDDVLAVIAKCGGRRRILDDWGLVDDLDLSVSDGKTSKDIP
jgi:hypothetical protein